MGDDERVRFPCRFGVWYLDDEAIHIDRGPVQTARMLYSLSTPAFLVFVTIAVYAVVSIVVDRSYFFRSVGVFVVLLGMLVPALLAIARLVGRSNNVVSDTEIPLSDLEGVAVRRSAGARILLFAFRSNGEQLMRPVTMPLGWFCDVDAVLDSVKTTLRARGIPFDDGTHEDPAEPRPDDAP